MISQVSVMPRRSIPLLAARSDRAGALSGMERALKVPRRRPRTPVLKIEFSIVILHYEMTHMYA